MRIFRSSVTATLAGLAFLASTSAGVTQDYPDRTVVWVVTYPPGGSHDVVARIITPKLSDVLGQSVIIENIPGASATIGATKVAEAAPDGYTILQAGAAHTLAEALHKDLRYNLLESFEPVMRFDEQYYVFVVNPSVEAETLGDLIDMAKAEPDKLNYASAGTGTPSFMSIAIFLSKAGITMTHIPYEGGGPATLAVVSGESDLYASPYTTAKPFIDDGQMRVLAVSSGERLPYLPDVPAAAEFVPGFELSSWHGIMVPKGTPTEVRDKIRAAMVETLADPDVKEQFDNLGLEIFDEGPEDFAKFLSDEVAVMKEVLGEVGIAPQ